MRSVLDVARSVLAELDIDVVLDRVLEAARDLTGARYAAIGVLNESRTELDRFLTLGIDEVGRAEIGELPRGRGVLGELINHPEPLRLARVGHHPRSWGFPAGHPPMESFLGVPILVGGKPFGNLYLTETVDGGEFSQDDEDALVLLADFAGVAIDHAGRYTGARRRHDELERTVAVLDATLQIGRAVGGQTDLDVILELVAKRGRALVSARTLLIELQQGDELVVATGAGEFPQDILGRRVSLEETVASAALRTRRTQQLDEELNRSRFEQHGLGQFGIEVTTGMVVPMVVRDRAYGVLVVVDRLDGAPRFTADDQRLLEAFAASAATAVAMATSVAVEQHRQRLAAAEDERRRWARELHDETLQGLAAMRLRLSTGLRSQEAGALEGAVTDAIGYLEHEIPSLRALITDLRPAALDDLGTKGAIETLVERVARQGIDIELSVDLAWEEGRSPTRHTPELETAMYRIVQEAIGNAIKHGGAEHATVEIREDEKMLRLTVRDDGKGFDPTQKRSGFGLLGIRERVELLDGTLAIDSTPGAGATLSVVVPVRRRELSEARPLREITEATGT
jgi:signal transduction histidine kinase